MSTFSKLVIAGATAAMLAISPAYAQTSGSGGSEGGSAEIAAPTVLDERATAEHRMRMGETFRGLTLPEALDVTVDATVGAVIPETAVLHPVPDEIVTVVPESRGYQYFTMPDGRIVLVHPADRTVAMVLD
jgi:hypothetical protein